MSAGAALGVVGLWSGQLPPQVLRSVFAEHPRAGFKRKFHAAWAAEAAAVPRGRAQLLRHYGALGFGIQLAPITG